MSCHSGNRGIESDFCQKLADSDCIQPPIAVKDAIKDRLKAALAYSNVI